MPDHHTAATIGPVFIDTFWPFTRFAENTVDIHYSIAGTSDKKLRYVKAEILRGGIVWADTTKPANGTNLISLGTEKLLRWRTENPELYTIRLTLLDNGKPIDVKNMPYGFRAFEVSGPKFFLSLAPFTFRAASIDLKRNDEVPDSATFANYYLKAIKDRGGNGLYIFGGIVPEYMLSACDRMGIAVQLDYDFTAFYRSKGADTQQLADALYKLDAHPSVVLLKPLLTLQNFPPMPDTLTAMLLHAAEKLPHHALTLKNTANTLHNTQFRRGYESLSQYYNRFTMLGKAFVPELGFETYASSPIILSNPYSVKDGLQTKEAAPGYGNERPLPRDIAPMAEFWRRAGAAGIVTPSLNAYNEFFTHEKEDISAKNRSGIKEAPMLNRLNAFFSPRSLLLEMEQEIFSPGQNIKFNTIGINETDTGGTLLARLEIKDGNGKVLSKKSYWSQVLSYKNKLDEMVLKAPLEEGNYLATVTLLKNSKGVLHPVVSEWNFRVMNISVPEVLEKAGVSVNDTALFSALKWAGLKNIKPNNPDAGVQVFSRQVTGKEKPADYTTLNTDLEKRIKKGKGLLIWASADTNSLPAGGFLSMPLPFGLSADFRNNLHEQIIIQVGSVLPMNHLSPYYLNGLGNMRPYLPYNFTLSGIPKANFESYWVAMGADIKKLSEPGYKAYEMVGKYKFGTGAAGSDEIALQSPKSNTHSKAPDYREIVFETNPKLRTPNTYNLAEMYAQSLKSKASKVNMAGTGIMQASFGAKEGNMIVAQAISLKARTDLGRTAGDWQRYDPEYMQEFLNMLALTVNPLAPVATQAAEGKKAETGIHKASPGKKGKK
ncbi:MAG: hypothetical protein V4543_14140 [Bacteroidota bacterium]